MIANFKKTTTFRQLRKTHPNVYKVYKKRVEDLYLDGGFNTVPADPDNDWDHQSPFLDQIYTYPRWYSKISTYHYTKMDGEIYCFSCSFFTYIIWKCVVKGERVHKRNPFTIQIPEEEQAPVLQALLTSTPTRTYTAQEMKDIARIMREQERFMTRKMKISFAEMLMISFL